jgi:hypothetical protein
VDVHAYLADWPAFDQRRLRKTYGSRGCEANRLAPRSQAPIQYTG